MDDPAQKEETPTETTSQDKLAMPKEQESLAHAAPAGAEPADPPTEPTAQSTVDALETAHGVVMDPAADQALQEQVDQLDPGTSVPFDAPLPASPEEGDQEEGDSKKDKPKKRKGIRGIASWFETRAHSAISRVYQTQADDLEERAKRVVGSAYKEHSDDLEERAIRVLRSAISDEADRIKEAISHGVAVKKIEVRLSLLVLVVASLIYLGLYWFTQGGGAGDK